jgi:Uri superfamily endonuclease
VAEREPGSYLLVLRLDRSRAISVGKLGRFDFAPGWYVYAGSALGGLEQRLAHHLRPPRTPRWHVDYLRQVAEVCEVRRFPGRARRECDLARAVRALASATTPVARFGASDCRCPAHLIYFVNRPSLEDLTWQSAG